MTVFQLTRRRLLALFGGQSTILSSGAWPFHSKASSTTATTEAENHPPNQIPVGEFFYSRTTAEIAAHVVPTNYSINSDLVDPRRYGAVFDGATDDTAALNQWVAVVNACRSPVSTWPVGKTTLCGPLDTITANNFTWNMCSIIKVKPNSWTGESSMPTSHISLTGVGARIFWLSIDGNQRAFDIQPIGQLLSLSGSDVMMDCCSLTESPLRALELKEFSQGRFTNCRFDSNCNLGSEIITSSYLKFTNCTWNYNGYGFRHTRSTNAFAAFGFAIRFRSHHITFVNCEALQNGRDGMNVNQGSYAVKFIGCLAWMNGDGGFTIAADDTSKRSPGNHESPHDLEYIDCESYNNWSAGLAAYASVYNVTVESGRYYNNHRLANQQPTASAFPNGLYFAAGSLGVRVRTKAYDDRQLCRITEVGRGTMLATGWVAGTMANYPRVAFYDAAMKFQGYGTISAESSENLTITSDTRKNYHGVSIPSISVGWYVSQRVQHNGVFFDNGCTGSQAVVGFGQLPGAFSYTGFKAISGFTSNGQNILLPEQTLDYTELLANPTFDAGIGADTSWYFGLAGGGNATWYTAADSNVRSAGALQLTGGISVAQGDSALIPDGLAYAQGCWVEASVWTKSVNSGDAFLQLFWNPGTGALGSTVHHPGGGYKHLKIGAFIPVGTTSLTIRLNSASGKTNYFDNASLRVKPDSYDDLDYNYPSRNLSI